MTPEDDGKRRAQAEERSPQTPRTPRPPAATRARGAALARRLAGAGGPLILDGATGTELERAGLRTGLPLWSTHALLEAPEAVLRIHTAYRAVGAEILTANTFRTQRRTLARAGLGESDARLTRLAVELARLAASPATEDAPPWVAGSLPPLEDCYRPDLVPSEPELAREHGRQAELLGEAGVDLILIETMNDLREARAAARAAAATGLPFVVSFVAGSGAALLSGEPLARAAAEAVDLGACAVGVNCLPIASLAACRRALAGLPVPLLAAPNLGQPEPRTGFTRDETSDPRHFPDALAEWLSAPHGIVGGCCGTTPAHIAALAARVRGSAGRPAARR
jgi:S-methylmethionine-dependent homocysteine/selenocysteine methylase